MKDVVRVRSARLVARLIERGCYPVARNADGSKMFSATSTVRQIVKEYTDEADLAQARGIGRR